MLSLKYCSNGPTYHHNSFTALAELVVWNSFVIISRPWITYWPDIVCETDWLTDLQKCNICFVVAWAIMFIHPDFSDLKYSNSVPVVFSKSIAIQNLKLTLYSWASGSLRFISRLLLMAPTTTLNKFLLTNRFAPSCTQCAAVTRILLVIKVAPQMYEKFVSFTDLNRAACHGHFSGSVSEPLTMYGIDCFIVPQSASLKQLYTWLDVRICWLCSQLKLDLAYLIYNQMKCVEAISHGRRMSVQ